MSGVLLMRGSNGGSERLYVTALDFESYRLLQRNEVDSYRLVHYSVTTIFITFPVFPFTLNSAR